MAPSSDSGSVAAPGAEGVSLEELLAQVAEAAAIEAAVGREPEAVQAEAERALEGLEGPPTLSATSIARPAIDLIIAAEISSRAHYDAKLTRPMWPGGQSGPTIGIGYDVGTVNATQLRGDWNGELASNMIEALVSACGVLGPAAANMIPSLSHVVLAYDPAERVFFRRSLPQFVAQTERALPNTGMLGPDCLGALVSLTYNRGPAFSAPGDRFAEMRAIRAHGGSRVREDPGRAPVDEADLGGKSKSEGAVAAARSRGRPVRARTGRDAAPIESAAARNRSGGNRSMPDATAAATGECHVRACE